MKIIYLLNFRLRIYSNHFTRKLDNLHKDQKQSTFHNNQVSSATSCPKSTKAEQSNSHLALNQTHNNLSQQINSLKWQNKTKNASKWEEKNKTN
jgi:hypothetical protein